LDFGMNKRPHQKTKTKTQAAHPETQRQHGKAGAPGSESSKALSRAQDVRNAQDKDGNSEQRGR
jgi:hypothetical protein